MMINLFCFTNAKFIMQACSTLVITLIALVFGIHFIKEAAGIRIVNVSVPKWANIGSDVKLECNLELEDDELYSLKWFLNGSEFLSYTPSSEAKLRYFKTLGIVIEPDKSTNGQRVLLKNINYHSSGLYKCEVSAERTFQTQALKSYLSVQNNSNGNSSNKVISFDKPQIVGYRNNYHLKEVMDINCIYSLNPNATLQWILPNYWITRSCPYEIVQDSEESILSLTLVIQICHLDDNHNITLSCQIVHSNDESGHFESSSILYSILIIIWINLSCKNI